MGFFEGRAAVKESEFDRLLMGSCFPTKTCAACTVLNGEMKGFMFV